GLSWLNTHLHWLFAAIAGFFDALIDGLVALLGLAPAPVVIGILSLIVLKISGWRYGLICLVCLAVCLLFDMWTPTIETLALVLVSVLFSVMVGVPLGVLAWRKPALRTAIRPCLDIMQTLPPWVYLVPAVILFGLGTVPAILSTIIYGIAPMTRLTILAMSQIPPDRIELGHASGASKLDILRKIELPSALPTLVIGLNQCILLSLAMMVLAGLVGAGGLGSEVTQGLTRMDFGLGLRASLAIVALAIAMD